MDKLESFKNIGKIQEEDLYKIISNGKNAMHLLAARGDFKTVKKLLEKFPKYNVYATDDSGNTMFHLMLKNGFCDEELFELYPYSLIKRNVKGDYVIYLMIEYLECFIKNIRIAVEMYPDILTIKQSQPKNVNNTVLLKLYTMYSEPLIKKEVKWILKNHIDLNDPINREIFLVAVERNDMDLFKLALSHVKDSETFNKLGKNSFPILTSAVIEGRVEMVKAIFEKFPGTDVNATDSHGGMNPLHYGIHKYNPEIWAILKKHNPDYNQQDKDLDTVAHEAVMKVKDEEEKLIMFLRKYNFNAEDIPLEGSNEEITKYFDEALTNINNDNPDFDARFSLRLVMWLSLIDSLHDIFLKADLTIKNAKNMTPVDLIKELKLDFLFRHKKLRLAIAKSLPEKKSKSKIKKKKLMLNDDYKGEHNFGIFDSDLTHTIIYTYIYLTKYKNLSIPFQGNEGSELFFKKLRMSKINLTKDQDWLWTLLDLYSRVSYGFLPGVILWRNRNYYYFHDQFEFHFKMSLRKKETRFSYLKISFMQTTVLHAGCILYDKKLNKAVRFEPYGTSHIPKDHDMFDNMVKEKIEKAVGKPITYLSPDDYMGAFKWQELSNETDMSVQALGDPSGYCLAWCFWWIGLKVLNPDIDDAELLRLKNDQIKHIDYKVGNKYMAHIRSYANRMNYYKNKFLEEVGVDKLAFHKRIHVGEYEEKISNELDKRLKKLLLH